MRLVAADLRICWFTVQRGQMTCGRTVNDQPMELSVGVCSQAILNDSKGPKDAVEGTAVVVGDQARTSDPVRSRTAHFLRRAGIGAPLFSTYRVELADSARAA